MKHWRAWPSEVHRPWEEPRRAPACLQSLGSGRRSRPGWCGLSRLLTLGVSPGRPCHGDTVTHLFLEPDAALGSLNTGPHSSSQGSAGERWRYADDPGEFHLHMRKGTGQGKGLEGTWPLRTVVLWSLLLFGFSLELVFRKPQRFSERNLMCYDL